MKVRVCLFIFCFVVLAFLGKTYAGIDPDMLVYLPMNEGSGDEAADASENGRNGTILEDAEWIEGKYGGGLELTTVAEIQIPDDEELDGMQALTLELWVRQESHEGTGLIQKGGNWPNISYLIQPWSDQQIYFGVKVTDSRAITKPGDYPLGEWYHLAGTFDGETLTLYINGEEKASAPAPVDTIPDTVEPLQVGNRFTGAIDEFVMYSRVLTQEEIKADMDGVELSVDRSGKLVSTWASIKSE